MTSAEAAALFRGIADRLDANDGGTFGGAFLVVPPEGMVIDSVFITSGPNPAVFWSSVEGQVSLAISDLKANQQQQRGGYR